MRAGTMEGLIGASENLKMMNVPMNVYREEARKGNTAGMEQAMGYVEEFSQKAYEYKEVAEEELRKEMKEEKEEQKIEQEKAIMKHREETKEFKEKITEKVTNQSGDNVVISEDGKMILSENTVDTDITLSLQFTDTKFYSCEGKTIDTGISEVKISANI